MPLHQKNTRDMRLNSYRLLISENKVAYMMRRINKSSSSGWQEMKENQKCMPFKGPYMAFSKSSVYMRIPKSIANIVTGRIKRSVHPLGKCALLWSIFRLLFS